MALINCPECGMQVSDKAIACPKCACPILKAANLWVSANENDSLLQKAEQLYKIGQTEEAINTYIDYTDKYPKDWETQIKIADICDELIPTYYVMELKAQKYNKIARIIDFGTQLFDGTGTYVDTIGKFTLADGGFAHLCGLRERMLKFALLNATSEQQDIINKRLTITDVAQIGKVQNANLAHIETIPTHSTATDHPSHATPPPKTNVKKAMAIGCLILAGILLFMGLIMLDDGFEPLLFVPGIISLIIGIPLLLLLKKS